MTARSRLLPPEGVYACSMSAVRGGWPRRREHLGRIPVLGPAQAVATERHIVSHRFDESNNYGHQGLQEVTLAGRRERVRMRRDREFPLDADASRFTGLISALLVSALAPAVVSVAASGAVMVIASEPTLVGAPGAW